MSNEAAHATWNGPDGENWATHRDRLEALSAGATKPFFDEAAIGPSDQVLDIGCGSGHSTRAAALRASRGHVHGIDISQAMLRVARTDAEREGIDNVTFLEADAQTHAFDAAAYDVAISRAGVMFFDDPVAAFGNVRSALRPGGRFVFLCHRDAPGVAQDLMAVLSQHLEPPTDATPPPVDFTDDADLIRLCDAAGFSSARASAIEYECHWGDEREETVDFVLNVHLRMLTAGLDPEARRDVSAALDTLLIPHTDAEGITLPAHGWLVTATV
ncbi:class I SAM-dependent methyltransferase [Spiractinospora alimapuensis]|uniref:class I SAM-dependent methyltransferase n=1 Tax=Spiractinospora alimapuensis TaxID=2820884 RepID=UPI001F37E729|nr:class I SAM-dependent methyltransferase [Spiractinospora alimapuensis]QVQ52910.1 class I SAM-dependent methyltransferase [Spiractinospora alimapuensis]